jgi:hypothetical protein
VTRSMALSSMETTDRVKPFAAVWVVLEVRVGNVHERS